MEISTEVKAIYTWLDPRVSLSLARSLSLSVSFYLYLYL